jgi:hypothetical protein
LVQTASTKPNGGYVHLTMGEELNCLLETLLIGLEELTILVRDDILSCVVQGDSWPGFELLEQYGAGLVSNQVLMTLWRCRSDGTTETSGLSEAESTVEKESPFLSVWSSFLSKGTRAAYWRAQCSPWSCGLHERLSGVEFDRSLVEDCNLAGESPDRVGRIENRPWRRTLHKSSRLYVRDVTT